MDGNDQRLRGPSLALVFLLVLVLGHVQTEDVCKTGCKGAAKTFKYALGTTYKYNYDGKIEISLSSAEGQTTSTEVKAEVLLTQLNDCNQVLRLNNVQVLGSNGKKVGTIPDVNKPIRINFNDGELTDSICVVPGDNQNSINIKRAIASAFQASLKSQYETDVFGRCPTELSSHKEGNLLVIQKARSLNKCAYRENIHQAYLATAFNLNSEIKSSPLLNGDYRSTLKLKNGVVDQVTIVENYLFVPFSVGQNGAKAQVTTKLQFAGTSKDNPQAPVSQPRSIIFEDPHPVVAPSGNVHTIINAVKEVAKTIEKVVSENTANEFVNLVKVVRVSKKADLLAAYNQIKSGVGVGDKDAAGRLYLDALLESGNGESVEAIIELLKKNELSEIDTELALLGLSIVRHATEGSLTSAAQLLGNPKLSRDAYLGIGNLAGQFCRQHPCENNAAVKTLLDKIASKLVTKAANREQENDIVYSLKALGNTHFLNDNILQKLTGLAQAKNLPNRIRVAALEAYLADPCKNKLRDSALQILQDVQQDAEIRIRAYLAVAQCPNAKAGNSIKALLEKEPSIQVGGFITTHLRTVQTSTNPDKALAKQFFNFTPKKRFPFDPRRYSFNGDLSYAIDTLGVANSAEANVIYSQNSWLPRSTSLNLTAQLFGHHFNFLEIETRQENLDRLIEHYLGPSGVLKSTSNKEFVSDAVKGYDKLKNYVEGKLKTVLQRAKRDVTKAELDAFAKQVQIKTNELNKDVDVDFTLRAFGSELFFLNVNQEADSLTPEAIIDKIASQLSQGLDRLANFQETVRRNLVFLDAQIDYPTSLGFPLRLAVEGSAALQAQLQGSVDLRKVLNNPDNGQLSIKIIPSANIEVAGRLTLDALVVENGLKVVSTLYTATGGDASLSWEKSNGFTFKYSLPVQEQKIVSANHEIVFQTREQTGREQNLPLKFTQVKDFSICLDQLSPFIGLTFCAEINGPNVDGKQVPILPFPFAGDAKLAVTIENDDASAFVVKHTYRGNPPTNAALVLESIGKNGAKKATLDLQAEYSPERYLKASLTSQSKTAGAELRYISNNLEHSLVAKVNNDQNEYSAKLGVGISGSPEHKTYRPILEVKTPGGEHVLPIQLEGQVVVDTNGNNVKYRFENLKLRSDPHQFSITGYLGKESGVFSSDIKVSDGKDTVSLQGRLQASGDFIKFNAKVQNTINHNADFHVKGEIKLKPKNYESSFSLVHGPDLNSKKSILSLENTYVYEYKSPQDYKVETKNKINYPLWGFGGKFDFKSTQKELEYAIGLEVGEIKLGSELELEIDDKTEGDYDLEFELWGLENKLELKSKREVLPNDESKIANTLEINGKKLEINGKIKHGIRPHSLDVGSDLTVRIPTHTAPFKVYSGLKVSHEEFDGFGKITSGNDVIVDAFLKAYSTLDANGSIKVNIKNIASINGKIHSNKGSGNGDVLIDIQNGKRQVKAESTFQIVISQQFDLSLTLFPSFNKEPNTKLFVSTKNKYSQKSLDSQNKIDILGNPVELNIKASESGDSNNGKEQGEIELTLLNDQYFVLKGSCDHQRNNNVENGQAQTSLEYRKNKNAPGNKLTTKGTWKNTNLDEGIFDLDSTISAEASDGQNINFDIALQGSLLENKDQISLKSKLYGNALKNPLQATITAQDENEVGQYEITISSGPENAATIKGSYDLKSDTKASGSLSLQANTATKALKTLNFDISGSVSRPQDSSQPTELDGSIAIFADDDGTYPDPIIDVKAQGNVRAGATDGQIKGSLTLSKIDPISADVTYKVDKNTNSGSITLNYANGKTVKLDGSLQRISELQANLVANLQTPIEGYKNVNIVLDSKRSKDNKEFKGNSALTIDGNVYKLQTELALSDLAPVIDLKFIKPDGKLNEIYIKGTKVSDRQFSGEARLINQDKQFALDGALNVNIETVDNFLVKGQVNCPALNWNKITFEAANKPGNNDRKIQVLIKSANKNLLSGTANYNSREEGGKIIVEGSGTFKVKEETKSGNFKYIVQRLETAKNNEQGKQISFDGVLGTKAIDAEFKLTDKQFRAQTSYCEQKQDCVYAEIDSKITSNDLTNFEQVLEVNLDLRKLGLSHEFGLKSETKRKEWVIDHTVNVHFQNQENSKYQYTFFFHPQEAGLSLVTPKRIVSLESKSKLDQKTGEFARGSGDIGFYFDKKNHPTKKTALTWNFDANVKGIVTGNVHFTHPGLKKPLSASIKTTRTGSPSNGKLEIISELDIFAQENQKIVSTYIQEVSIDEAVLKGSAQTSLGIQSKGLGIDILASDNIVGNKAEGFFLYEEKLRFHIGKQNYDNAVSLKWSPKEINGLVKILNKDIVKFVNKLQLSDKQQIIDSEISSYDNNPMVSRLEVKDFNTVAYNVGFKNTPNNKLTFNAGLIPGQIADIRSDYINAGAKTPLFFATVKLDDADFLKSDYKLDSKAIEDLFQRTKQRGETYFKNLESLAKEWSDQYKAEIQSLGEVIKKAQPNLNPLKQYYTKELEEFKQEILNDKSLKEVSEAFIKVLGAFIAAVSDIIDKLSQIAENAAQAIQNTFSGVIDTVEKQLIPLFKELYTTFLATLKNVLTTVSNIVFGILAKVTEIFEKYQADLKSIAANFSSLGQDLGRIVQETVRSIKEYIERLPQKYDFRSFDEIKEQISKAFKEILPNVEVIVNAIGEIFNTIKDIIPQEFLVKEEISQLLDTLLEYLSKKIKNEPVNDGAVLNKLTQLIAAISNKIVNLISTECCNINGSKLENQNLIPANLIASLPRLVAARFSILNYLEQETTDDIAILFVNMLRNPIWIPPFPLFGLVIQGQHIFTFDNEQFTVPGSCNYLFVRDAVNGNFSIAGSYKDGQLVSITLADKTDVITLVKGGQVKVGNAVQELPVRRPHLAAFRDYEVITLLSTAGASVVCVPDLSGCAFSISGFYHGQVKGLLGNGNSEPYDDYTLPNGKVVTSQTEFVNSYKLNAGCADVTVLSDRISDNSVCNKLFSIDSSMSACYPFVPTTKFKSACARGLAANVKGTEEALAKAYVAACQQRNIPIEVPENLVKCINSDKPYSVGERFSVKLPSKSADVVIILDTEKQNEILYKQLLQPLLQDLTKEFHSKGVNDVEYHLITYGGLNQWPTHNTLQGKLTFKGKAPPVKFGDAPKDDAAFADIHNDKIQTYITLVKELLRDLSLATGMNLRARTFDEAYKYPFRVTALKSIIVINGEACEVGRLYPIQELFAAVYTNPQISINLFAPTKTLSVKDSKKLKDIVGFNTQAVFTLSQGKKNPKGTSELHKEIKYDDYCLEYVVNNRGNVFVNENFLNNKAEQKQFLHIAAVNIVDQLINLEQGLDCECKLVNPWKALNVCNEVFSKDRSSKKV